MHPPSPVSPAVMVESTHSIQFPQQMKTASHSNGSRAEFPAMWGAPQSDTSTRVSPRPTSSLSGSSRSQQSPLLPPPSPSSRRGAASSAGRGIDALLLSSGDLAPAAHPAPSADSSTMLRRQGSPKPHLSDGNISQLPPSPKPPLAPPSGHPSKIRAAAAQLADRVSADKDIASQSSTGVNSARFPPVLRPRSVTPQPSASAVEQDGNDLALKLSVVAGPGTDTTFITARDIRQVSPPQLVRQVSARVYQDLHTLTDTCSRMARCNLTTLQILELSTGSFNRSPLSYASSDTLQMLLLCMAFLCFLLSHDCCLSLSQQHLS